MPWPTRLLSCALVLAGAVSAQEPDTRDTVVTTRGEVVRGRVVQRYDESEILVAIGGKRVHLKAREVKSMDIVLDRQRQFFALRGATRNDVARAWMLADWARTNGLPALARLQAMHVVLLDDDHAEAHRLLGHRQRGKEWLWPRGDTFVARAAYEAKTTAFGSPKLLDGEHFRLRSNADLRHSVDALFDLERLYVFWFDEFGSALRPNEVLDPMDVHLHRNEADFPHFTSLGYPYYYPQPNGDVSYTYLAAGRDRPVQLFEIGTEQLIYNSLTVTVTPFPASPKDRIAAWIEIGFGQWMEARMGGDAGYAEPRPFAIDRGQAAAVLGERFYGLANLIGLRYDRFHDPTRQTPAHWANCATFVAFLLQGDPAQRTHFLSYVYSTYNESKGNSSSLLDKAMGTKIEKLEQPWREWVAQQSGLRSGR